MKKIILKLCIVSSLIFTMVSCDQNDIETFNETYDAIRFPVFSTLSLTEKTGYDSGSKSFIASFSFIDTPFVTDTILNLPIMLIGKTAETDRIVSYKVDAEKTTAPEEEYKVLDAVIPANSFEGYIRVQLMNSEELNDTTYQLALTLQPSNELSVGPSAYLNATVSWNNAIPMPPHNNLRRTYNMLINSSLNFVSTSIANYSPNAMKAIVAATGWNDWDDYEKYGANYNNATTYGAYKYLPRYTVIYTDNSYKSYALKLANYIKAYNEAHPDAPLRHDAGGLKGELIVARSY